MTWTRGRVYVGPVEIAGHYAAIVAALRTQGVPCDLHLRFDHPFAYNTESVHPGLPLRVHRWVIRTREQRTLPRFPHRVLLEALRRGAWLMHAIGAITRYQTFVFAFGMTFAGGRDLSLLRLLGKRIIVVVSNGSEARAPYVNGSSVNESGATIAAQTLRTRKQLTRIERWADAVIGAPLSSSTLMDRPFINYFSIGMPLPRVERGSATRPTGDRVSILHAPSNLTSKGTHFIRAAVQELIDAGYPIDYLELSAVSHNEVLDQLTACDLVVDQVYSDTPMATLAAEAATANCPSVVGGYGWEELRRFVSDEDWPPSAICQPQKLKQTIEELVADTEKRKQLGNRAREFVATRWEPSVVGARLLRVLTGDIPDSWWVDPLTVNYTNGSGLSDADARRLVVEVVHAAGVKALCLQHNPGLEKAFLDFAGLGAGDSEENGGRCAACVE